MKAATNTISIVRPRLSLPIMLALLRAAIAERPVTEMRVAGMRARTWSSALSSAFDDRQQLARVDVGNAAGDDDGVLLGRDEAAGQILRQHVDILLEGVDIGLAGLLGEPAPQCLERPDVADAGLLLDDARGPRR